MQGSGVLLKIADAAFVLSAGHVLKQAEDIGIQGVQIGPMAKGSRLIKYGAAEVTWSNDLTDLDLGFIHLTDSATLELSHHKKFARMDDLDLRTSEPFPGAYCILGFPRQFNSPDYAKREISARHFHYLSSPVLNAAEAKPGVSILFELTKDIVTFSDPENSSSEEIRMPELNGISGCGMWRLYGVEDRTDRLDKWQPTWIRLVGIEHGWVRRKWVKGTFIRHVIDMIENAYPDLRASLCLTR
jgi:hypothetical protein